MHKKAKSLFYVVQFLYVIQSVRGFTGDVTSYGNEWKGGNCGFTHIKEKAKTYFAAINNEQWDSKMNCGLCAQITCTGSRCHQKGKQIIVLVTNRCPECKKGDMDISDDGFKVLTGSTPSRIKIKWDFIQCPADYIEEKIEYYIKPGSNRHWFAIQPRSSLEKIVKIEVRSSKKGTWYTLTSPRANSIDSYYFLAQIPGGLPDGPFNIRATSISKKIIVDTFGKLVAGNVLKSSSQYGSASKKLPTPKPSPKLKPNNKKYPPKSKTTAPSPRPTKGTPMPDQRNKKNKRCKPKPTGTPRNKSKPIPKTKNKCTPKPTSGKKPKPKCTPKPKVNRKPNCSKSPKVHTNKKRKCTPKPNTPKPRYTRNDNKSTLKPDSINDENNGPIPEYDESLVSTLCPISVSYYVNQWSTGFVMQIYLNNKNNWKSKAWKIKIEWKNKKKILQMWNANYILDKKGGNNIYLYPKPYNYRLPQGENHVGFIVGKMGEQERAGVSRVVFYYTEVDGKQGICTAGRNSNLAVSFSSKSVESSPSTISPIIFVSIAVALVIMLVVAVYRQSKRRSIKHDNINTPCDDGAMIYATPQL